jgi:nicotinate dehydrogenase subunit B
MVARRRARLGSQATADQYRRLRRVSARESEFFIPQPTPNGFNVPFAAATLAGRSSDDHIAPGNIFQNSDIPYTFPDIRTVCRRLETISPVLDQNAGANAKHLRQRIRVRRAAAAAGADPIAPRHKYLDPNDKRGPEVLDRVATLAKSERRPKRPRFSLPTRAYARIFTISRRTIA